MTLKFILVNLCINMNAIPCKLLMPRIKELRSIKLFLFTKNCRSCGKIVLEHLETAAKGFRMLYTVLLHMIMQ